MQHNLNSRDEKINFLKNFRQGKMSLLKILPPKIEIWICKAAVYEEMNTNEKVNQFQYKAKIEKQGFKETDVIKLNDTDKVCVIQKG